MILSLESKPKNKVREYRNSKYMKQSELAAQIGVSQPALSDIENGKHLPNVIIAMRLSEALGYPIESMFFDPRNPEGNT